MSHQPLPPFWCKVRCRRIRGTAFVVPSSPDIARYLATDLVPIRRNKCRILPRPGLHSHASILPTACLGLTDKELCNSTAAACWLVGYRSNRANTVWRCGHGLYRDKTPIWYQSSGDPACFGMLRFLTFPRLQ
jgi:hypothetical protein